MKKNTFLFALMLASTGLFAQAKKTTSATIRFDASTPADPVAKAENKTVIAALDPTTGIVQFEAAVKNFAFENKKVEEHFVKNKNVAANQRLHDIWMATSINGGPINKMVTVPRMEINLTEMKIFGTDGCNEYNGIIEKSSDKELKFGRIASTRMMCPEMEVADKFNKAMNTVASYKLDGLKLHLMDSKGKEVLSFLKVD